MRKETSSTLLTISAAIALLLLSSPLILSNFLLLQPAQATLMPNSIQTRFPVALGDNCNVANTQITFDAQGNRDKMTSGTFQITNINNSSQILWSGDIDSEDSGPDNDGGYSLIYNVDNNNLVCGAGEQLWVDVDCGNGTPDNPNISLETNGQAMGSVSGTVDCGSGGDTTAAQPSPSSPSPMTGTTTTTTTTTTQDSDGDGDGIPDSSDRCTHNSNPRCFKEGGDTSTTTQSSSTSMAGNQTR